MKKIFLILLLLFNILQAKEVTQKDLLPDSYFIKLGVYKSSTSIEQIKRNFANDEIYIRNYKNSKAIYMVNFSTKKEAKKKLGKVKKTIKDSYILKVISNFEDIANRSLTDNDKTPVTPFFIENDNKRLITLNDAYTINQSISDKKQGSSPDYNRSFFVDEHNISKDSNTTNDIYTIQQPIKESNTSIQTKKQESFVFKEISDNYEEPTLENNTTHVTNDINTEKISLKNQSDKNLSIHSGLTLKAAVLKALNRNNKILSQREKVIQAKRKLDEAKAAFRPKVVLYSNMSTDYTNKKDTPEEKYVKGDVQLSITQNLYAGGKDNNTLKKEEMKLESILATYKSQVEKETITIIESYLSVIYEKESITINRKNMKNLKEILNIVTIKEENGAATKGDLNYIKSNVENAASALVKAESKFNNSIAFYRYYMGKDDDNNTPIEKNFDIKLRDRNTTIELMKKNNTALKITKYQLEAEKYNYQSKYAAFRPKIDLIITGKDKRSKSEAEPAFEDKASAMLSLNYNLYNGGKDQAIKLGIKSKISALNYKLVDLYEGAKFNTIQLYGDTTSAKDSLTHTHKEVQANLKVVDSYWNAFKYGTQDLQALLLGQRALTRSQLDEITEKQTYTQSYFKLLAQIGELLDYLQINDFINPAKIIQE